MLPGVEKAALLDAFLELARSADLEVRFVRRAQAADFEVPTSATCRVRGDVWVLLSTADPVDVHLDVIADALRTHAAGFIEGRYLVPAVRERLIGTA